ncbi:MAG TPA: ABC transporter ATP-binding protein [Clostridiales bacterium]|nr:ABC transporter ATP-binding protein [Clostridiales bacterium]
MEISIDNLTKNFGKTKALDNISLKIGQGMFGLLGKNGAGKTTLMRTIATLINKTQGEITVCGVPVEKSAQVRKIIGYLPQEFSLYPKMRVFDVLDYLGVLSGMSKKERKTSIDKVLEEVNLSQYRKAKVKVLSGGMKRRLGIAQAILHNPKVLIVDEPTAGLDPQERIRFRNLLCDLAKDRIVILSTHIVEDIQSTCEDIAILDNGKILYKGRVNELIKSAQNHVFTIRTSREQSEIIKSQFKVTAMVVSGEDITLRLVSEEKPFPEALVSEPTMEDAYMYLLGGEANHVS